MPWRKTSAWPLALVYGGLVIYASLYPFTDWRDRGVVPWSFLTAAWPQYWTGFDLVSNVLGYAPLGFLLALSALRSGRVSHAVWLVTLLASALSFLLESVQVYLPARVPSNVDWALNTLGALAGAALAALLEKLGAIARWNRFRARWFVPQAHGALVLLALWPVALLFPAAVPLGLGQVLERVEAWVADLLQDSPFLEWLPIRDVELQPLLPVAEWACVWLGVLIPCLLGYSVIRGLGQRVLFAFVTLAVGAAASALSAALSYGPAHAWAWLSGPVLAGLGWALVLSLLLAWVPARMAGALLLLALGVYLSLINQAPTSAYFAQTLQTWEQGRFIRFHGLVQWLGWLWPYATLWHVLAQVRSGVGLVKSKIVS